MKKLARFLLGVISTLLLSAGLSRAASKVEPLSLDQTSSKRTVAPTPDCGTPCHLLDEQT